MEALIVDAGVVGQLVDDRDADLFLECGRVREVSLQRQPEQRDLVGQHHPIGAPLRGRDPFVQAVEPAVLGPGQARLLRCRRVFDDDGHILEQAPELFRQAVEGTLDQRLERLMLFAG